MNIALAWLPENHSVVNEKNETIVLPGELVTDDQTCMRGHGTYSENGSLYASLLGTRLQINKLTSVIPLYRKRYIGEIGDVVIGRITHVQQKQWQVDIHSTLYANLKLSAIILPGGEQRRKLESDELEIRRFFVEGDVFSAEVQAVHMDGSVSLHTRSLRYGKLSHGLMIHVSPNKIKRSKSHFHTLSCGIDVILGLNGFIWIGKHFAPFEEHEDQFASRTEPILPIETQHIARIRTLLLLLVEYNYILSESIIEKAYDASLEFAVASLSYRLESRHEFIAKFSLLE